MTLQVITYLGLAFSIAALIYRAVRIAKMPIHLRWELYPVPHEKGKGNYGGSFMEEFEWWTKPRETSMFSELKEMAMEIIFIKSLFEKNRSLWIFSFPFHFGLYFLIGFAGLLVVGGFLQIFELNFAAGIGSLLQNLTVVVGAIGIVLTLFGGLGLLVKRMVEYDLKTFSTPSDYFNLILLVFVAGAMLVAWLTIDQSFTVLRDFTHSLLTASAFPTQGLITVEILAVLFFLVYLPFTHMTHFIAKYFTYHDIRWNDEPNEKDSKISKEINKVLQYPVSWSAPHIKGDGKKTWVDVATKMEDNEDGK